MLIEVTLTEPFTDGGRWDADGVQHAKRVQIVDVLLALDAVENVEVRSA